MNRNGILCLEGDWEHGLIRRRSLVPVLDLIQSQWDVPFIHRTASTRDEFRVIINEWLKAKYSRYPILYLGFHGAPGALLLGSEIVPIRDLFEFAGKGAGRMIHFGTCETLNISRGEFDRFIQRTGVAGICGFKKEVDWLHSCSLEILVFDQLSRRRISSKNLITALKNVKRQAGPLVKNLGFEMLTRRRG